MSALAWWKFDEGTGTSAADSAGSNTGTLTNGATWVTGYIGPYALSLDGTDDYVSCGTGIGPTGDVTVSFWFKSTDGTNDQGILGNWNGSGFMFYNETNNSNVRFYCDASGGSMAWNGGPAVILDGNWHHIVGVKNNPDGKIYCDGILRSTNVGGFAGSTGAGSTFYIGKYSGSSNYLAASIDDVRVYDNALSLAEIKRIYETGAHIYMGDGYKVKPIF